MKAQKIFRRKELAVSISLLLAASGTALAQDQVADDQDNADEFVVEEVVVTGLRKSLENSMNLKKDSILYHQQI